ncbi:MAG TPA: hypothetical protein VMB18_04950 [Terriglobales bacterium]|nr:hypothetical protein [Terriglobales bacterium]
MYSKTILLVAMMVAGSAAAQQAPANGTAPSGDNPTTVRGCLNRSRGNYLVVEDKTGLVYALRGVGDKVNGLVGHEVEATGQLHPGSMKTGVRSAKAGSNPADTVHGVEGVPLQVADVSKDVRQVAKKCIPADQQ